MDYHRNAGCGDVGTAVYAAQSRRGVSECRRRAFLFVTGVLNTTEAFSGFISTAALIIGVMCVVVAGLSYTGVLQWITRHLLGQPKGECQIFLRLTLPVAVLSSFIVNDTVVMFFVSVVKMWAKKLGIKSSHLLIPMAYAAGMGGALTIMVTTSGLVISGLIVCGTDGPALEYL